jgi:predicted kinase
MEVIMNMLELQGLIPAPGRQPDYAACLGAFPVLERAKATPQDPRHHGEGDVWTHTMMVCDEIANSAYYAQASDAERFVLFLAALLHDVSKADTTVIDPVTGHIGQPGHSKRGAIDARVLLWRAGVQFDLREAVCRLIAVHQVPFFALASNKITPERLVHKLSWELDIRLLAALAEADMRGRVSADQARVLDDIELFRELARQEVCYGQERHYVDAHTRVQYARHAKGHPDYPFYPAQGSRVILMSGLPASGKNTWVEWNASGLPVVSFDDAKAKLGLKHGENDGEAAHFAVEQAKALLRAKAPFVWNATNINPQLRDKSLDLLYSYDAHVRIVYLESSYDEIRRRNAKRDTTLSQAVLERMFHRWDIPAPAEAHEVQYQVGLGQSSD